MPISKLREYLEENDIKYEVMNHSTAYTALEVAQLAHISGREIAKTVMVKIDGKMAMIMMPASFMVDLDRFEFVTWAKKVELAHEDDFVELFPDCEIGAMPPFGNLYGMKVYIDLSLAEDKEIAFNAGNHRELIKMSFADFDRLVQPGHLGLSCKLAYV